MQVTFIFSLYANLALDAVAQASTLSRIIVLNVENSYCRIPPKRLGWPRHG